MPTQSRHFYLFPDQSDNQSEKEQHEDETADTAGDVAVAYKECDVIPERDLTFDDSLLPPWSGL
jgi:hypothetical protein